MLRLTVLISGHAKEREGGEKVSHFLSIKSAQKFKIQQQPHLTIQNRFISSGETNHDCRLYVNYNKSKHFLIRGTRCKILDI